LVELAESTIVSIFAEAADVILGAAEELEPIRCVSRWLRAGVRMGRLGRAICIEAAATVTACDRPASIRRRKGGVPSGSCAAQSSSCIDRSVSYSFINALCR
jgi:hypothetical protein